MEKSFRKARVYIASPYTVGDVGSNVRVSMEAYDKLAEAGYAPFSPLWSHFQHIVFPKPYEYWLDIDLEWIGAMDAVLRLTGESPGAEVEVSASIGIIPVYFSLDELFRELPPAIETDEPYYARLRNGR